MQIRNLVGQRFGRLVVLSHAGSDKFGKARWTCRCDCGTECTKPSRPLIAGESKSCGCLHAETVHTARRTHGRARSPVYRVWATMKGRCENPTDQNYPRYGGRGIRVCDRWQAFAHFLADMGEPPPKHTLERKDNNGNYEPDNCCWATMKEQQRNTRSNLRITYRGETLPLAAWAERIGIAQGALHWRIRKAGWSIDRALTTPSTPPVGEAHPGHKLTDVQVEEIRRRAATKHIAQVDLATEYGVSQSHIARLLKRSQRNQG